MPFALNSDINTKISKLTVLMNNITKEDGWRWYNANDNYSFLYITILGEDSYYHSMIIHMSQISHQESYYTDGVVTIKCMTGAVALIIGSSMNVLIG